MKEQGREWASTHVALEVGQLVARDGAVAADARVVLLRLDQHRVVKLLNRVGAGEVAAEGACELAVKWEDGRRATHVWTAATSSSASCSASSTVAACVSRPFSPSATLFLAAAGAQAQGSVSGAGAAKRESGTGRTLGLRREVADFLLSEADARLDVLQLAARVARRALGKAHVALELAVRMGGVRQRISREMQAPRAQRKRNGARRRT